MTPPHKTATPESLDSWHGRGAAVLSVALVVMAVLAVLKLGDETYRLVFSTAHNGAIDLRLRYDEVHRWFAGLPVYTDLQRLTYPPEAYVMLWPLVGWLGFGPVRWLWAATSALALISMSMLVVRESAAETRRERMFIALMLLSMNAVGVTLGNGQLGLHLLAALVAALVMLRDAPVTWTTDLTVATLMLVALIKPTLTMPFVFVALNIARRFRPFVLGAIGYVLLTLLAVWFQPASARAVVAEWWTQTRIVGLGGGYGDIHAALALLGREDWQLGCTLAVAGALGAWTYRCRHADPWILVGVAGLAARFWSYHRLYDDVLIVLPLVAIARATKSDATTRGTGVPAAVLLSAGIAAMLLPARMEVARPPINWLFVGGHVAVWLLMLVFLVRRAETQVAEYGAAPISIAPSGSNLLARTLKSVPQ
jgi:Glycosyltransferase family 87